LRSGREKKGHQSRFCPNKVTKFKLEWMKNLSVRYNTMKCPEGNTG
jgi:hypothetical protein